MSTSFDHSQRTRAGCGARHRAQCCHRPHGSTAILHLQRHYRRHRAASGSTARAKAGGSASASPLPRCSTWAEWLPICFAKGIGIWGLNNSVGWAFDITNFVFWVGIGHAGTLISAILLLFRQQWRTSINRSAEAMTIFAVMCAGMFPAIHMGRPWDAFFIFPYFPNQRGPLWVNFRSPLVWDVFAISTYLTISLVFWYLGMIPDLATLRDRATGGIKKFVFRLLSLGWNGSHRTWSRYEIVSLVLAGLATPLVLSVHSIVSMDFATSLSCRAGTPQFFHPTSSPAPSTPDSAWC